MFLVLLEAEGAVPSLPTPTWVYGVIGFVILLIGLLVTLSIGKGRPHS
jgi:hypothetical protein